MSFGSSGGDVAPVLPGRVSDDPRLSLAVYAAAWLPAIAVTLAGSRGSGSTAASSDAPGISARSLCASRSAIPDVYLWSKPRPPLYPRYVPWEVSLPLGQPGEDRYSSSGIYPFPVCFYRLPSAQSPPCVLQFNGSPATRDTAGQTRKQTKEKEEEHKKTSRCTARNQAERSRQRRRRFR